MTPDRSPLAGSVHPPAFADNLSGSSSRIFSLDVLRGIAVLCALFVSILLFGGFTANQQNGLLIRSKGFDYRLFGTMNLLFEGKMRALISIVFGAAMILFLFRTNKEEKLPADFFMRRQLWLIIFGLINAFVFLWSGDMLFHLGVMGILLFPFVRLQGRGLLIAAIITTFIFSAKHYWNYADDKRAYKKFMAVTAFEKKAAADSAKRAKANAADTTIKKDTLTKKQKEDKEAWEHIINNMKYDPKKDDGEKKDMRSKSYGKIWNHILPGLQWKEAAWTYQTGIWDFASMILLGMALFKFRFFSSRFSARRYLLFAVIGLSAGLLLGWYRLHFNQLTLQDYPKYISDHALPYKIWFPFERGFMVLGYASLILYMLQADIFKRLWKGFALAGQMALTNYLMQSIICTIFFTGFGMGYFGRLQQYHLYIMVIQLTLVQIAFSALWLSHFYYGPAEWLLRCLIYKKWFANKKSNPLTTQSTVTAIS